MACLINTLNSIFKSALWQNPPFIMEKNFYEQDQGSTNSLQVLEDTARYAGLLLAHAECFGLRPRLLCLRAYYAVLAHFRPFSVSISNLGNWMFVRTQFGHGRTRLSVRAHSGYGRTNFKKSKKHNLFSFFFNIFSFAEKKKMLSS